MKLESAKNIQPLKRQSSYIIKSLRLIENGCYSQKGKLKLDGEYGDYRMSMFRLKDRLRHMRNLPSLYNPEVKKLLFDKVAEKQADVQQEIKSIIQTPLDQYLLKSAKTKEESTKVPVPKLPCAENLFQENQQLMYVALPKYQQERWFTTPNQNSTCVENKDVLKPPSSFCLPAIAKPQSKLANKGRHIFRSDDETFFLRSLHLTRT